MNISSFVVFKFMTLYLFFLVCTEDNDTQKARKLIDLFRNWRRGRRNTQFGSGHIFRISRPKGSDVSAAVALFREIQDGIGGNYYRHISPGFKNEDGVGNGVKRDFFCIIRDAIFNVAFYGK